jgi:hypothetical protein
MFLNSRALLLSAGLMALPLATAMAQQNNPAGNLGSNRSTTATPGTADSKAASGMHTGDVGTARDTGASNYGGSGMSSTTPGATGKTVVPGSTSSQANSANGTRSQQTGGTGGGTSSAGGK